MHIIVNGESKTIPPGMTVSGLLEALGLDIRQVAVERQGHIVPRSQHPATVLNEGDTVEIVQFIGGG
jgi:sulfur carrier protein